VIERDGLQSAREITNRSWMISDAISSTFHGRDIFSPAAAHLAAGWDFTQAGPEVNELVRLKLKSSVMNERGIDGEVIGLDDPYGSLVTNVPGEDFKKTRLQLGRQSYGANWRKACGGALRKNFQGRSGWRIFAVYRLEGPSRHRCESGKLRHKIQYRAPGKDFYSSQRSVTPSNPRE